MVGLVAGNSVVVYHPVSAVGPPTRPQPRGRAAAAPAPAAYVRHADHQRRPTAPGMTCTWTPRSTTYGSTYTDLLVPGRRRRQRREPLRSTPRIQTLAAQLLGASTTTRATRSGRCSVRGSIAQKWRGIVGTAGGEHRLPQGLQLRHPARSSPRRRTSRSGPTRCGRRKTTAELKPAVLTVLGRRTPRRCLAGADAAMSVLRPRRPTAVLRRARRRRAGGLLGLFVGSFLNVVIYRVPRGESVVSPRVALPGLRHAGARRATTCPCVSWLRAARPLPRLRRARSASATRWSSCSPPRSSSCWRGGIGPDAWALPAYLYLGGDRRRAGADRPRHEAAAGRASCCRRTSWRAALLGLAARAEHDEWSALPPRRAGHGGAVRLLLPAGRSSTRPAWASATSSSPASSGMYLGWLGWGEVVVGGFLGFLSAASSAIALMVVGRAGRKSKIPFGPFMLAGALVAVLWPAVLWQTCTSTALRRLIAESAQGRARATADPLLLTRPTGSPARRQAASAEGRRSWQDDPPSVSTSGPRACAPPSCRSARAQVTLEKFGQVALPEGAVRDGEVIDPDAVAAAIKQLWAHTKFSQQEGRHRRREPEGHRPPGRPPVDAGRRAEEVAGLPGAGLRARCRSSRRCSTSTRSRS